MRVRARLTRQKRLHATTTGNIRNLTDKELIERMRFYVTQIGLDWEVFKMNPVDTIRDFFEGVDDDDGLIANLLSALEYAGTDWLQNA